MKKLLKPINFSKFGRTGKRWNVNGRRIFMFLLMPFVLFGIWFLYQKNHAKTSYAADPLVVTYEGNGPPAPMFNIANLLPGDIVEKTFNIKNTASTSFAVKIDGVEVSETKSFAQIVDIEIIDSIGSATYFSGKLQSFFDAPLINLGNLAGGADKNYKVKVSLPLSAGNEYQDGLVEFNIMWLSEASGTTSPTPTVISITPTPPGGGGDGGIVLPAECSGLQGKVTVVLEGTDGNDRLNATNASELILGKNGDDRIFGIGGDDCIVGGGGNDRIQGGQGSDVILAGDGNDKVDGNDDGDTIYGNGGNDLLDGDAGNDNVYGGTGSDKIDGGSGNDIVEGNEGSDDVDGGSGNDSLSGNEESDNISGGQGNDVIRGGTGSDKLDGDSGTDAIFGDADSDYLDGGSQNDTLTGGTGTDALVGGSGSDACSEGENLTSCEL